MTGATGLVGRLLCLRLAREGYEVSAWVRSTARARANLGAEPHLVEVDAGDAALARELSRCEVVFHLAGEGLFAGRWNSHRKAELHASRVALTRRLVAAIGAASPRPSVLVSANAVGRYGACDDRELDESSPAGDDFLARLCSEWESAALEARAHGLRVAVARIGIVLTSYGGALARMLPLFQLGLGGRLGSGRQWMSWIHVEDLVELLVAAARDARFDGAFNATAPAPATNRDFTAALARELGRPALIPAPRRALLVALGEAADVLCTGQRVVPTRALELGFGYRFASLPDALRDLLDTRATSAITRAAEIPPSAYLAARRPHFELRQQTFADAPLERVFDFFSRAENLGAITPPSMSFSIATPAPIAMRPGARIDYRIALGPLRLAWSSGIETWEERVSFVDVQLAGPYASWWHEHRFRARDGGTQMDDRVLFALPLGGLGRALAQRAVLARLRAIFDYRARAIAMRFGPPRACGAPTKKPVVVPTTTGLGLEGPTKLGERAVSAANGEHGA